VTDLDKVYAALGSEVRLEILRRLASRCESCACELVELLNLSRTTVSYHIARLREAGLVVEERRGRWRVLRLRDEALAHYAPPLAETLASLPREELPPLAERVGCPRLAEDEEALEKAGAA